MLNIRIEPLCMMELFGFVKTQQCDKAFVHYAGLKIHTQSHRTDRSFSCENCPKTFKTKRTLVNHMKLHYAPNLQCSFCDKKCRTNSSLRSHVRIHTGEKPHACKLCGENFNHLISLKTHMAKKHT